MNSKQRIAHEKQLAHYQQQIEKNKAQNKAIWKKFCSLNLLEQVIVVTVSSTLLFSTSYGLVRLSEASDADALRYSRQQREKAFTELQELFREHP
jgi:hypothetical protein